MPSYDRGMVYKFDDEMCGNVIYERIRDPKIVTISYKDLRFPASDIPLTARYVIVA